MLRVSAMEPATGKQTEITVRNYSEVAQSKGKVKAAINRGDGAARPEDVQAAAQVSPKAESIPAKPAKVGKAAQKPAKAKKEKGSGGGLLGALFGRKRQTVKRPPTPAPVEEVSDSIIDQVVAEREAAKETAPVDPSAEPGEPKQIEMPEVDPSALEALESEPAEPAAIQMPALGDDELESLDDEDLTALEPEALSPLPEPEADASEEASGDDEISDLGGEALSALDDDDVDDDVDDDFDDEQEPAAADGPATVDMSASAAGSQDIDSSSDEAADSEAASDADGDADTEASEPEESEEERVERQRQELMDRLSQPLGESESSAPDPEPAAAPISPEDAEPSEPSEPAEPSEPSEPEPPPPPAKKPARLKLSYKNPRSVVREYMENLQKGGSFVKTSKPLAVGREVIIEIRVPAIADDPIVIPGMVTWSSRDLDSLGPDEVAGMGIEYKLDEIAIAGIEARLSELKS